MNFQSVSQNNCIVTCFMIWLVYVMDHSDPTSRVGFEIKVEVVVLFVLIAIKVYTVEIEQTVGQLVASKCAQDQSRAVPIVG